MPFEILGEISDMETIATASGIREIARLRRTYGGGRCEAQRRRSHSAGGQLGPFGRTSLVRSFRDWTL